MILIIYGSAGQGHKSAAIAIEEELKQRQQLDSIEILDSLSVTTPFFAKFYPWLYQFSVHYLSPLWSLCFKLFNLKIAHRLDHFLKRFPTKYLRNFSDFLRNKQPRTIVFTHFLGVFNAIQLRKHGELNCKIISVVTDFYAHALWIHRDVDEYCVMAEETKEDMIRNWQIKPDKIKITGIPVSKKFTDFSIRKDKSYLETLGLEKNRLTLLFSSGSFGLGPTEEYLSSLKPLADKIQAIIVCGNNTKMKIRLDQNTFSFPVTILGFVNYMQDLMDVSDLLVAKPGGITTCEALIKGVPMIISSVIPGQEEGNLKLLEHRDACWHLSNSKQFFEIIKNILANPEILSDKKKHLALIAKPNATNDIADIILKS